MKRFFLCMLVMFLVPCIGMVFAEGRQEASKAVTEEPSVDIEFASYFPTDHNIHLGLEKAKQMLSERSGGRINLIIYPNGTYSTQVNAIAALKMGALDMASFGPIADAYPPAGVLLAPYAFKDYAHWRRFRTSALAQEMLDNCGQAFGAVWLKDTLFQFGFRYVASKVPAKTPEDFADVKLRVVNVPPYQEAATILNARGTPVPITEVYMALRTGVVDATENPLEQIYTMKFHEPTNYLVMTGHILAPAAFTVSMRRWNSLSEQDQDLLQKVFSEVALWIDEQSELADEKYLALLEKEGLTVIKPDVKPFMDRAPLVLEKYPEWKYFFDGIRAMQ